MSVFLTFKPHEHLMVKVIYYESPPENNLFMFQSRRHLRQDSSVAVQN